MSVFLGIDVAKTKIDAALLTPDKHSKHKVFPNSPEGFEQLSEWLTASMVVTVHACLEATGSYGDALARYLHEQGHIVSIVNPAAIRAFGKSKLSRTKTDKADATLIALYCQMHRPPSWEPPQAEIEALLALVRRLESLQQMRQMEANRQESLSGSETTAVHEVRRSMEEVITFLDEQIRKTRQAIQSHIDQHPTLRERRDLLTSIPGIGEQTAATLLAEMGDLSRFRNSGQVAAYAGLVPRLFESGSSVRGRARLSKFGSSRLRKALYFPALVAMRMNPVLAAFRQRQLSHGKSRMLIVGAVMRKLLCLVYGVLKSGKPFDPTYSPAPVTLPLPVMPKP